VAFCSNFSSHADIPDLKDFRLKPDAPEFISIDEVPTRQSSQRAVTKETARRQRKEKEKEEHKKLASTTNSDDGNFRHLIGYTIC